MEKKPEILSTELRVYRKTGNRMKLIGKICRSPGGLTVYSPDDMKKTFRMRFKYLLEIHAML